MFPRKYQNAQKGMTHTNIGLKLVAKWHKYYNYKYHFSTKKLVLKYMGNECEYFAMKATTSYRGY